MSVTFPQGDPRKRLAQFAEAVRMGCFDACTIACLETERLTKTALTDLGKVDRGTTRNSVDHRVSLTPTGAAGVTFIGAPWGVYVEFGRRGSVTDPTKDPRAADAAWPPVSVIRAWVARNWKKLAPAGRTASGRARRPSARDIDTVTYLIGRKIARHGIKPAPALEPSYAKVSRGFTALVARSIDARRAGVGAKA